MMGGLIAQCGKPATLFFPVAFCPLFLSSFFNSLTDRRITDLTLGVGGGGCWYINTNWQFIISLNIIYFLIGEVWEIALRVISLIIQFFILVPEVIM